MSLRRDRSRAIDQSWQSSVLLVAMSFSNNLRYFLALPMLLSGVMSGISFIYSHSCDLEDYHTDCGVRLRIHKQTGVTISSTLPSTNDSSL